MDRLARNLDDLRRLVRDMTAQGIAVEFVKEKLTFTGTSSLMLSVMGAFAEFERALTRERQREGIALAKRRGVYRGRKRALSASDVERLCQEIGVGKSKAALARELGICRQTLHLYLKRQEGTRAAEGTVVVE